MYYPLDDIMEEKCPFLLACTQNSNIKYQRIYLRNVEQEMWKIYTDRVLNPKNYKRRFEQINAFGKEDWIYKDVSSS